MARDRQEGRRSLRFPLYAERVDAAIRKLLGGDRNYSEVARRSEGRFESYYVARLAKAPPAELEDLEDFANILEVPWQWLVVGDECAEELIETRKRLRVVNGRETQVPPISVAVSDSRRPPPGIRGAAPDKEHGRGAEEQPSSDQQRAKSAGRKPGGRASSA